MKKRMMIVFTTLEVVGGVVTYYLKIRTSALTEPVQVALLAVFIGTAVAVWAYLLGLERGHRKVSRSLQNLGILRAFRRVNADRTAPLSNFIQNATSDIFFMGLSLPKLDAFTGLLEDKASNGVQIRLLVPDPYEEWLVFAIAKFLKRKGSYPLELSWFFNNFLPIWQKVSSNFHVRVYKQMPTMSATMFDNKQGNVELYMYGWKTDDRLILELDFGGTARDWKANLDMIWHEATPLSSEKMFFERIKRAEIIARKLKEHAQTSKS